MGHKGVALVAVILVLALLDGTWLIAFPAAIVLAPAILALS